MNPESEKSVRFGLSVFASLMLFAFAACVDADDKLKSVEDESWRIGVISGEYVYCARQDAAPLASAYMRYAQAKYPDKVDVAHKFWTAGFGVGVLAMEEVAEDNVSDAFEKACFLAERWYENLLSEIERKQTD